MMRRTFATSILAAMAMCTMAQQADTISYANTIAIGPNDSEETIVAKAAHVVPTRNQIEALKNEFIAFVHFGPNTFTRKEWGNGMEDPKIFAPTELDTDQWCQAMAAAGMKMVLLTAKHHDGFVLWQSRYTKHGIMSSTYMDGKGDVMRSLSASCRKYGLKLGVYLSPADLYHIERPDGLYGNLSQKTLRTIPRPVEGRPFANKTTFQFVVDDYNEYFLNQLFELLTEYGPIHEVWFDGAHPKRKGGQTYDYAAWKKLIHTLAPQAVVFGREDVRWCGNEAGNTRHTEWNVIPYQANPDTLNHFEDMTDTDLGSRQKLMAARYLHYQQPETDTSIRDGWFYRDETSQRTRSADEVFDIYERSVGGNATLLLNIPPNREGRLSQRDVDVLTEVGKRIEETYGRNLLPQGTQAPQGLGSATGAPVVDGSFELHMPQTVRFNRIVLQEAVATRGERVEKHAVDIWQDGQWQEVAQATNIGYKRILRIPDVETDRLRVRILSSRLTPYISQVSLGRYEARPPQLTCSRTVEGMVSLQPAIGTAPQDAQQCTIHFTTNGTTPTAQSPIYTNPFSMPEGGELKAVAVCGERTGAVMERTLGMYKAKWQDTGNTGAQDHAPHLAWDEDPSTFWQSASGDEQATLTVDLGIQAKVTGFAYTPQRAQGMMTRGIVWTSTDGKRWKQAGTFEFGNLVNDPTQRFHHFTKATKARYVRLQATATANPSDLTVCVAELDILISKK